VENLAGTLTFAGVFIVSNAIILAAMILARIVLQRKIKQSKLKLIYGSFLAGRTERDWIKENGTVCTLRAAALIIRDGKLLVAKNADYDVYYPIGGGIELGESSVDAVKREVFEETGRKLEIDRLAFTSERFMEVGGQKYHEIGFYYLMRDNYNPAIPDGTTTDIAKETLHWLPLRQLKYLNIVPEFLKTKALDDLTGLVHIIANEG